MVAAAAPWQLPALELNKIAAKAMRRSLAPPIDKPAGKNNDKNVDNPSVAADERKGPDWQLDPALWDEILSIIPVEKPTSLPALIGTIDGGIKVLLVDGNDVKVKHDMDYVDGGNDAEAPEFIPKGEIWLDASMLR